MTDEKLDTVGSLAEPASTGPRPVSLSRRAILRGTTVALPTILTLNSGSAFAAASNYVGASSTAHPVEDHYICLETGGQSGPSYYYGDGANAWAIPSDHLFVDTAQLSGTDLGHPENLRNALKQRQIRPMTADRICTDRPATYMVVSMKNRKYEALLNRSGQPVIVSMPRGALLSATAFHSLDASGLLRTKFLV